MTTTAPSPRRWERAAWIAAAAWTLLIFATIPIVRSLQGWISGRLGSAVFSYLTLAGVIAGVLLGLTIARRTGRRISLSSAGWLAAVAGVSILWISRLGRNPEEAVHILEYGLLAVLVANALRFRVHDATLFAQAALVAAGVGVVDELIQWVTPERYFDFRDIWLNAGASSLALVGLWKGVMPPRTGAITAPSVRRLCRLGTVYLLLLASCLAATPARIDALAGAVPALSFLADPRDAVAEYGHRHHLESVGSFKSRFTVEELGLLNRDGAADAASIIQPGKAAPGQFLKTTSRAKYPYAREAGVRILTRSSRLGRARKAEDNVAERRLNATEAVHENLILEKSYSRTLELSRSRFGGQARAELSEWAVPTEGWESLLDRHLITIASQAQLLWLLFIGLAALVLIDRMAGRRIRSGGRLS